MSMRSTVHSTRRQARMPMVALAVLAGVCSFLPSTAAFGDYISVKFTTVKQTMIAPRFSDSSVLYFFRSPFTEQVPVTYGGFPEGHGLPPVIHTLGLRWFASSPMAEQTERALEDCGRRALVAQTSPTKYTLQVVVSFTTNNNNPQALGTPSDPWLEVLVDAQVSSFQCFLISK